MATTKRTKIEYLVYTDADLFIPWSSHRTARAARREAKLIGGARIFKERSEIERTELKPVLG